jgi:2-hydroxycyclohexanecarboxyl-CoA dehydrogenase
MEGLEGRVAVVTGAGGAIGRAIVLALAEAGCVVAVFDKNVAGAHETARLASAARGGKGRVHAYGVDITDLARVKEAALTFEKEAGPVDILVNNAGWDRVANFLETEPAFWDELIAINLRGPLNMHHAIVRGMAERKRGRVVNIA